MNNPEFIIMDSSVKRMNARNVLEEGIFFTGYEQEKETWCRTIENAKKYNTIETAVNDAKRLTSALVERPPRIFTLQQAGNGINVTEIKY